MVEEWAPLVANLGFPIVISVFLLVRVERRLEELTERVKETCNKVSKLL